MVSIGDLNICKIFLIINNFFLIIKTVFIVVYFRKYFEVKKKITNTIIFSITLSSNDLTNYEYEENFRNYLIEEQFCIYREFHNQTSTWKFQFNFNYQYWPNQ